jgi:hypothetical protein
LTSASVSIPALKRIQLTEFHTLMKGLLMRWKQGKRTNGMLKHPEISNNLVLKANGTQKLRGKSQVKDPLCS